MPRKTSVGVIGAGAGGIAMGIQLADGGYDFTIFDRADGFGGTWRHNTFPGAACDVPSHLYSYSFAPNPRWSKTYANQPEILTYLEKVASDYGLVNFIQKVTELCRGKAYFTTPYNLGQYLLMDYMNRKTRTIH